MPKTKEKIICFFLGHKWKGYFVDFPEGKLIIYRFVRFSKGNPRGWIIPRELIDYLKNKLC